jgi:hypothetical protein
MIRTESKNDKKNLDKLRTSYQPGIKNRDLNNNYPTAFNNASKKVVKHADLK